jgi:hypothetical protein
MRTERPQDVPDVVANRLLAEMELGGDLFRRPALTEQLKDLVLAWRQPRVRRKGRARLARQRDPEDRVTTISALDRDRADLDSPATAGTRDDVDLVVGHPGAAEHAFELMPRERHVFGGDDGEEVTPAQIAEQFGRLVIQPGDDTFSIGDRARHRDVLERPRQLDRTALARYSSAILRLRARNGSVAASSNLTHLGLAPGDGAPESWLHDAWEHERRARDEEPLVARAEFLPPYELLQAIPRDATSASLHERRHDDRILAGAARKAGDVEAGSPGSTGATGEARMTDRVREIQVLTAGDDRGGTPVLAG